MNIKKNKFPDNPFVVRRVAAGLSQDDVAAVLGVDRSAVAQWETGRANPTVERLFAIAKLYGCSVNDLYPTDGESA